MTDREKLLQAELLLKEVKDNIMPPSFDISTLNVCRRQILEVYANLD